jgi:plastocyanin
MRSIMRWTLAVASLIALTAIPAAAQADVAPSQVQHLHFRAGPYNVTPGANLILLDYNHVPKPAEDGFMVKMIPNLHYARPDGSCCGAVPRVDVVHLHHGVWLSNGSAGQGEGNAYSGFYPFMASGEEKTAYELPPGYGYPIGAHDMWVLNYMIHNLTAKTRRVYITYDIDFVPATSPLASSIKPVHPIWMDVESRHIYPVFDVPRHSGRNGKYTFPDMARNPYGSGTPLNEFTIDHPGTLVATAGHVHPGGLWSDLDLIRSGATPASGTVRGAEPNSVRLFRSIAHYWDKRGPISWDMAMSGTAADWRPQVSAGDTLRVSATYETRRASWYESMGIMVVWEAWDDTAGTDPFARPLDEQGHLTHGHLPENNHHGGSVWLGVNPLKFRQCDRSRVTIAAFSYLPGDFTATGTNRCIPTVRHGQSLTFTNEDASPDAQFNPITPGPLYTQSIFHTVTSCQNPCGLDTGISYPLANGRGGYDSTQLGVGTPASGQLQWKTPANLRPGTYTYFCRIHPFMRGVFRIIR